MHVADDVKGAVLVALVVPDLLARDLHLGDGFHAAQHCGDLEALLLQAAQRTVQALHLVAHHMRAETAVRATGVAFMQQALRQIEHDGCGQHVVLARQRHQSLAVFGTHVGGVHHGEFAGRQPLAGDVVQNVEGVLAGSLIVLVVGHQGTAVIRRDHLRRFEMRARKGRFARPGGANQGDQRELGDAHGAHRLNTPIWVGGPSSGSTSPIGRNSTE